MLSGFGQRQFLFGLVRDSATNEILTGTHVRNISSDKLAITDAYGKFRLPAMPGDTLVFSNVGYQMLGWVTREEWFEKELMEFLLPVDTIYLEEVVIADFPEYQRFKQIIVETQPVDTSFWYHGVEKPEMQEYTVLEKKQYNHPLFIAQHPISFLHHKISKKEKEKRKMQSIDKRSVVVTKAQQKFDRYWVAEMTQLEGDELTDFIGFCKFTPEYLSKTPLYMIHERMMALLQDFKNKKSEG